MGLKILMSAGVSTTTSLLDTFSSLCFNLISLFLEAEVALICINEAVRQNSQSGSKSNDYGNNIKQAKYHNMCLQITTVSFKALQTFPAP